MENKDLQEDIQFYHFEESDYEMFIDCINDFYAGGYPYKELIDKNFLLQMIADKKMIVTVAKTKEGLVVGTSAAMLKDEEFKGSVLLLLRSVKTEYRGKRIGSKQEVFLLEELSKHFHKVESIYADVMTHDNISQTTMVHKGFVPCGFRMMLYKNEIMVPKLHYEENTKMTQVILTKVLDSSKVKLYAPDKHQEIIKNIYNELGVTCEFFDEKSVKIDERKESKIFVNNEKIHKSLTLIVESIGDDVKLMISKYINNELLQDGYTFVIYLNMNDENTDSIYSFLEEKGFYFTGIKPKSGSGEYLIMSHTSNCKENFKDIILEDKAAKLLKYFIEKRRPDIHE